MLLCNLVEREKYLPVIVWTLIQKTWPRHFDDAFNSIRWVKAEATVPIPNSKISYLRCILIPRYMYILGFPPMCMSPIAVWTDSLSLHPLQCKVTDSSYFLRPQWLQNSSFFHSLFSASQLSSHTFIFFHFPHSPSSLSISYFHFLLPIRRSANLKLRCAENWDR